MEQVKSTNHKSGHQSQDRYPKEKKQKPKQISRLSSLREKIIAQSDEGDGNGDQSNEANETIKHDREQCACFFVRGFLEQIIAFYDITARASWEKLIVKHADQEQTREAGKAQMDLLDLQQNMPAKSGGNFHDRVCQDP